MPPHKNDDAWLKVPLFGALGYAILLAIMLPRADDGMGAMATWLLLPTISAIGILVITATNSKRRWGSRAYARLTPATVLVLAVGLTLVTDASPGGKSEEPTAAPRSLEVISAMSDDGVAESGEDDASADDPTSEPTVTPATAAQLVVPPSDAEWTQVTDPAVLAADQQMAQWTASLYGVTDVVSASYQHVSVPGSTFRYLGVNGPIQAESPEAAGRASLVGAAGAQVVAFTPGADGWLGCNSATAQGVQRVSCAWVGEQRAVFLRWDNATLSMAKAASLTRAFRDYASA